MEPGTHTTFGGMLNHSESSRLIFEEMERAASIGGFLYDPSTQQLSWSRGMHRIYETDPETFTPTLESLSRFYSEEMRHVASEKRQQLLDLVTPEYAMDLELTTAKGNRRWIHAVARVDISDGRIVRVFGTVQDITERRRTEQKLLEAQALQTAITDSADDMIWSVDAERFGLMTFNEGLRAYYLRRNIHLAVGMNPQDLFPNDEYILMWLGFYERALREGAFSVEYATAYAPKRIMELRFNTLMRGEEVFGISVFGHDITKRKQMQEKLRQSELSYRKMFLNNSSIMLLIDPADGRIIDVNRAAVKFYGYSREAMLALHMTEINTLPAAACREAMESISVDQGGRFLFIHRLADGSLRDVEVSSSRIQLEGRTVLHSIIYDITERKRTERALREMEEQYRLIYENSNEAILFTNPDGRVYAANPEARRMLGRSEEEIRRLGRDGLIDRNDKRVPSALEERKQTGKFKGEVNFLRPDGTPFPTQLSSTIFRDSSGEERTSMFIQDITEKKKAEDLLRQSNEQLRLLSDHLNAVRENERTRIAREVHDELGQVFTGLKMEMMMLLRSASACSDEIPPAAYTIMRIIESGIHSVQQISSSLRPRLLDDFGLIPAIEWQAEEFQKRTGIPITLSLPPEEHVQFSKDVSTAVFRIVQETLTNILRHARATRTSIELHLEDGHLHFAIADNGIGISPEAINDPSSFGLIGIRERLHMFGGSVEFKNNGEGGGLTVLASIPLHSEGDRRERLLNWQ